MDNKYYTVEQIAEILSIHPKTIQRYIREGKLFASKIGKSWRVTGHDLSVFIENTKVVTTRLDKDPAALEKKVKISSVIDIDVDDINEAMRIVNTLTASLNVKPPEYERSTMYTQYLESENKVRVMLWGNIPFMQNMLDSILMLVNQSSETI